MSVRTYLPLTFAVDEDYKSDKFIKLRMRICHDGKNPNGSAFTLSDLISKKDSLCNSPILAHIYNDENDVPTIGGHDFVIEENKFDNSSDKIVYLEQPVGLIPERNNFEITEKDGVHYVNVDGYIWRGYSNYCEEIIGGYDELKISMEVDVLAYSYNASEDCYNISDFIYKAVTLLNETYDTGMKNARASIEDFSLKTTPFETMQKELTNEFSTTEEIQKGEIKLKLDDILKEYSLTKEELDFEITEDMDEQSIRKLLDDFVARKNNDTDTGSENETDDSVSNSDTSDADSTETENGTEETEQFQEVIDTDGETVDVEIEPENNAIYKREISVNEKFKDIYAKLDDSGIYAYVIDLYDTYFIYDEYDVGTYRQNYHVNDNGEVVFDGSAIRVYGRFLTEEELAVLDEMSANYSKLKTENEELNTYKREMEQTIRAEKLADVFKSFDKELGDVAAYTALKNSNDINNANMSVEDIEDRCYALLGRKNAKFSAIKKESSGLVQVSLEETHNTIDSPYGGLFSKYN